MDVDDVYTDEANPSAQLLVEAPKRTKSVNDVAEAADKIRMRKKMKEIKQIVLSLTKPSYVLGLGNPKVRADNRDKLYTVLRKLLRQQNWKEVSGVLSLVLKGTARDMCPRNNRMKYLAAMELMKRYKKDRVDDIERIFSVWMMRFKKLKGPAYDEGVVLQVEFILFLITIGRGDLAEFASKDLLQMRNYSSNPLSHMVLGLTYYQSWYSTLPAEGRLTKIDIFESVEDSDQSGAKYDNLVRYSVGHSVAVNNEYENQYHYDSETSVIAGKEILREASGSHREERSADDSQNSGIQLSAQPLQSKPFFADSESSLSENCEDDKAMNYTINDRASIFFTQGLDPWLFPFKLPTERSYEEFSRFKTLADHNDYRHAEEHLRYALHATPPVIAALVPLVQLLLLGDQVGKALQVLDKFSSDLGPALAFRLKASILDHFDYSNYADQISCCECLLKKDPTCSHAMGKLITLHREGEYDSDSLIEMIALHLDATNGECHSWKEFALCFFELSRIEEDRLSVRQNRNEHQQAQGVTLRTPKIFKDPTLAKSWIFRCKWWLNRHFGKRAVQKEITEGNSEFLAYKAACASHMYGRDFEYVQNVHNLFEQNEEKELLHFLQMHMQHSIGFYSKVTGKTRK